MGLRHWSTRHEGRQPGACTAFAYVQRRGQSPPLALFDRWQILLALLLPYAMHWVQRNGGIGGVLDQFRQKGLASHADSWVSAGSTEPLLEKELSRLTQGAPV